MNALMLISLRNLEKSYPQGPARTYVLRRIYARHRRR